MSRHLVCLSFDFDSISLPVANGLTSPTPISNGEFGLVGAERLLRLLERNGIRATWFIPGLTADTFPDACRAVVGAGHEIGHHGYDHLSPASLSRDDEKRQLLRGIEALQNIGAPQPRGYRSPAWDLSGNSVELLLECGFTYDSSMMGHDYMPYAVRSGDVIVPGQPVQFGALTSLLELPVSWSLDDYPHFEPGRRGGLMNAGQVFDNWLGDFLYMRDELENGVLTCTFHPFVIGRGHRMLALSAFINRLRDEGAEFVTAEDAVAQLAGC